MNWLEIIVSSISVLVVTVVGLLLERRMRKGDELRAEARKHDREHRDKLEIMMGCVVRQNSWISRKFSELGAIHNINHPSTKIDMDDYPNGIGD